MRKAKGMKMTFPPSEIMFARSMRKDRMVRPVISWEVKEVVKEWMQVESEQV